MSAFEPHQIADEIGDGGLDALHPAGAHRAFDALRGGGLVRVGRAAHDVGEADDFVDGVLLLVAAGVEFFQGVDPLQYRHQPDVILQSSGHEIDAVNGQHFSVVGSEQTGDVLVGGVVTASNFNLLSEIGDASGGIVEVGGEDGIEVIERLRDHGVGGDDGVDRLRDRIETLQASASGSTRSAMPPFSRISQMISLVDLFQISQTIAFLMTASSREAVFGGAPPPTGDFAALSSVHLKSS